MYFLRRQTPRKTRVENPYRSLHGRPPARLSAPPLSSRQPGGYCKRGRNVEQFFAARQRELRKATGDARSSSRISVYGKDELAAIRRFPRHVPYAQKQRLDKPVDLRIFPLCKIPRSAICVLRQPSIPACLQIPPAPERRCSRARANISCLWRMSHCATNAAARKTRSAHRQPERHIPHFPYNRTLRRFRTGQSPSRWGNGGNPPRISRSELSCS